MGLFKEFPIATRVYKSSSNRSLAREIWYTSGNIKIKTTNPDTVNVTVGSIDPQTNNLLTKQRIVEPNQLITIGKYTDVFVARIEKY